MQVKGDPMADLVKDLAEEQKARVTYGNILRLSDDPAVNDGIKFLREREIVHLQRGGSTASAGEVEQKMFTIGTRRSICKHSIEKKIRTDFSVRIILYCSGVVTICFPRTHRRRTYHEFPALYRHPE